MASDVFPVLTPHGEHIVTAALRAALAPQHAKRHGQLSAAVGAVVDEIDRGPGTVLVSGRPDRLGVPEAAQISGERCASFSPAERAESERRRASRRTTNESVRSRCFRSLRAVMFTLIPGAAFVVFSHCKCAPNRLIRLQIKGSRPGIWGCR